MPPGDLNLSAACKRLQRDRLTVRRRLKALGIELPLLGSSRVVSPEVFRVLEVDLKTIPRRPTKSA